MARSTLLLEPHLKTLRLPTFLREYDKLAQLQVYLDEFVFRHNRRKTPWQRSNRCSASEPSAPQRLEPKSAALGL